MPPPPWHIGLMLPKITNVSKSLRWDLKLTLCENLPGNYWSRTQIGQITHPLALLIKDDDNKSNFSDFHQIFVTAKTQRPVNTMNDKTVILNHSRPRAVIMSAHAIEIRSFVLVPFMMTFY